MRRLRRIFHGLHDLIRKRRVEDDLDEELRAYLDEAASGKMADGMEGPEAIRAARVEIGSLEAVKERVRGVAWEARIETVFEDIRFAGRLLRRAPLFTLVAILTLALGIGANAAVFSLVYSLLLRPLPYPDGDRLFWVHSRLDDGRMDEEASIPDYRDWQAGGSPFIEQMVAFRRALVSLGPSEEGRTFWMVRAPEALQDTLGVRPALGRLFQDDDMRSDSPPVVVLTHDFWRSELGGDPDIVGRTIPLDGIPHRVIGVTEALEGPVLSLYRAILPWVVENDPDRESRTRRDLLVLARLRPGVRLSEARRSLERIGETLGRSAPDALVPVPVSIRDEDVGSVRSTLVSLMGATGLILLLAFANVAYPQVLRGSNRRAELSMRAALGAARGRLVRLLLTESLLLALLGAIAGITLASGLVDVLIAMSPPGIPRIDEIRMDVPVLGAILMVTLVCGLLAGLAPVAALGRYDGLRAPRSGGPLEADRSRIASALVVSQLVLTLVLLTGAGLMIRSFLALRSVPTGIDFSRIATFPADDGFFGGGPRDQWEASLGRSREVLRRVREIPGVVSAALTSQRPLNAGGYVSYEVEFLSGFRRGETRDVELMAVSPGFFDLFRTRPIAGRLFEASDVGFADGVVVVDRNLAERMWADEPAVGQRVRFGGIESEVIGVVEPILYGNPAAEARPKVFHLIGRSAGAFGDTALVRFEGNGEPVLAAIRVLLGRDDATSLTAPRLLPDVYEGWFREPRFYLVLLGALGGLALAVALVGVYGAVAYTVARRRMEIGLRLALGARGFHIAALLLGRMALILAFGIAGGLLGAAWLTRYIRSLLFRIEPIDPVTMVAMAALLAISALAATLLPLRRASRLDPARTLRSE